MPDDIQPDFEMSCLLGLFDETENDEAILQFATTFLSLLPARVSRILKALQTRDTATAMDGVLSLKVTSSMVGALRMEQLCRCLEGALASGDFTAAEGVGAGVARHSGHLARALRAPLRTYPGCLSLGT